MNSQNGNLAHEGELAYLRKIAPIKEVYWAKKEMITAYEAVLLYYGIDPKGPHGIGETGFEWQIRHLDEDGIYELLKDSFQVGNLQIRLGSIRVGDFSMWLKKKGLKVPECFRLHAQESPSADLKSTTVLNAISDVLQIDFSLLSPAVLAALGANIITEISIRKAVMEKKTLKQKDVLRTNMLKELLTLCAVAEGKIEKSEDTIRGYIEHRFKEQ